MASFLVTGMILISLLLWSKDFVQRAGRALSLKALKSGKLNARLATRPRTTLLSSMPTWETKIGLSNGSTRRIRSAISTYSVLRLTSNSTPYAQTHGLLSWCARSGCRSNEVLNRRSQCEDFVQSSPLFSGSAIHAETRRNIFRRLRASHSSRLS